MDDRGLDEGSEGEDLEEDAFDEVCCPFRNMRERENEEDFDVFLVECEGSEVLDVSPYISSKALVAMGRSCCTIGMLYRSCKFANFFGNLMVFARCNGK